MFYQKIMPGLLLCLVCAIAHAQVPTTIGLWTDLQEANLPLRGKKAPELPNKFRLLALDVAQLQLFLDLLPADFSKRGNKPQRTIALPMPEGNIAHFVIFNDPIMHPDLARKYPEIQTFAGYGVEDPTARIRLDFSPHGFNAQILSDGKDAVYIQPVTVGDNRHHLSFFKSDRSARQDWQCGTMEAPETELEHKNLAPGLAGDCGNRREYRLALAATAEYTAFHGNTVASALAAMNTSMNRVNGVYERDLAIRMILVANTDQLIFTDALTDPYDNTNGGLMRSQNQTEIDMTIGSANYDIGHVFSTGGGGIATFNSVCNPAFKAWGVTGRSIASGGPIGDAFDIDYVAHEIGHQFNANHTFNENAMGSCDASQLTPNSAFEPGSGTTIMAYAGICGASNVQANSDAYFHARSLEQIGNYVVSGTGSTCPVLIPVSNTAPSVNAGADFTIPANTPFRLTATGSDVQTYCWEQMDNQLISHPPQSTATGGPVFRSFSPLTSPTRYFPRLPVILDPTLPSIWEVLPSVTRTFNFRVSGRDGFSGAGCTAEDDMLVNVVGTAGPFVLTSIGLEDNCLNAGDNTTIQWNVANTTAAPINCSQVDIWLSVDGGQSFSILLADNVPNDGLQDVLIPASVRTLEGRIMVIASNNIFLSINTKDIVIDCPMTVVIAPGTLTGTVRARDKISASGMVTVFTSAQLLAGTEVLLAPDFLAVNGSDFLARIQACDACNASTKPLFLANEQPNVHFYEMPALVDAHVRTQQEVEMGAWAFPNPFRDRCTVEFETLTPGALLIQLFDLTGKLVQTLYQSEQAQVGKQQLTFELSQLQAGFYTCKFVCGAQQQQLKLIKVD